MTAAVRATWTDDSHMLTAPDFMHALRMRADIAARLRQLAVDPDSAWHDPDLAKLAA